MASWGSGTLPCGRRDVARSREGSGAGGLRGAGRARGARRRRHPGLVAQRPPACGPGDPPRPREPPPVDRGPHPRGLGGVRGQPGAAAQGRRRAARSPRARRAPARHQDPRAVRVRAARRRGRCGHAAVPAARPARRGRQGPAARRRRDQCAAGRAAGVARAARAVQRGRRRLPPGGVRPRATAQAGRGAPVPPRVGPPPVREHPRGPDHHGGLLPDRLPAAPPADDRALPLRAHGRGPGCVRAAQGRAEGGDRRRSGHNAAGPEVRHRQGGRGCDRRNGGPGRAAADRPRAGGGRRAAAASAPTRPTSSAARSWSRRPPGCSAGDCLVASRSS